MSANKVHNQLRGLVADRIRALILGGQLRPGEWLRQARLAQELDVSQMPVREALRELAAQGLVEHVPYRGVRVAAFSADDLFDLLQARTCLESLAARHAAGRLTASDLAELHRLQAEMSARSGLSPSAEYADLHRRFHERVCAASHRPSLTRLLNQIWAAFPEQMPAVGHSFPERSGRDEAEHGELLAALERGDGAAAEAAMRRHWTAVGAELGALRGPITPAADS